MKLNTEALNANFFTDLVEKLIGFLREIVDLFKNFQLRTEFAFQDKDDTATDAE